MTWLWLALIVWAGLSIPAAALLAAGIGLADRRRPRGPGPRARAPGARVTRGALSTGRPGGQPA